ncbi:MAG: histidinol-phosphate transaminase [Gammaproteobacteria bacterium]|nr:histidinol-phosphate transaminase [Gammaproteobacteria bacterium]
MSNVFETIATPGVRFLQPYLPGKPAEEVERELGLTDVVKLASNESPLGPSPLALEAIRNGLGSLERYPDGAAYHLRKALAEHVGVGEAQLTIGNGSNDVLDLVARAFVTAEHEVIFPQYGFVVFGVATQSVGAASIVVPAKDWGADLEAMASAVTDRTRLVFIANPNNPTGTWVASEQLQSFISALPEHVLVVVDEAYVEFVDQPDYESCIGWLERFPNLIVTRTFSKAYGLAGLRVGYAVSHPDLADYMNRVRHPFNVNSLALIAAQAALDDHAHVKASVDLNRVGSAQLRSACTELGLPFIPSAGNFLTVDVGRLAGPVFEALLRLGVIVRPVANYGMPNHLRITVGRESDNVRVIDALTRVLAND